nr:acrosin-like [Anolis sagrei ordinatus]
MRRILLPLLALTTIRPMHTIENRCSEICGRRPLAPSHSSPFPIVGGVNTLPGAWPWMVSIRKPSKEGYRHTCGGSLIGATWVLTAAHCFKDKRHLSNWELVLGATELSHPGPDAEVRFPRRVVEHAEYQPQHQHNDLALIELDEPVLCNDYIQMACLPDTSVNVSTMGHCYIAGWGYTQEKSSSPSDILKEAKVDLISLEKCNSTNWYHGNITDKSLCAGYEGGGVDTCQGDSGGPLLCREARSERYWVVGVTSWGQGCARAQKPGVYTSTQHFYDWIQGYIKNEEDSGLQTLPPSPSEETPAQLEATPETETVPTPFIQSQTAYGQIIMNDESAMQIKTSPETTTTTTTTTTSTTTTTTTTTTQTPEETTSQPPTTTSQPQPPPMKPPSVFKAIHLLPPENQSQEEVQSKEKEEVTAVLVSTTVTTKATPSTTRSQAPPPKPPRRKEMIVSSAQYGSSKWGIKWPKYWPSNRQANSQN